MNWRHVLRLQPQSGLHQYWLNVKKTWDGCYYFTDIKLSVQTEGDTRSVLLYFQPLLGGYKNRCLFVMEGALLISQCESNGLDCSDRDVGLVLTYTQIPSHANDLE